MEEIPGDSEGQGNLWSPWVHRVRHDLETEQHH